MVTPAWLAALALFVTTVSCSRSMSQPNILVLMPDEWRWDWAGFGSAAQLSMSVTSTLAANGTRFSHAVTPAPLCAPGRACLALGRAYDNTSMPDNHGDLSLTMSNIYRTLQDNGYHTMVTGKDDLSKTSGVGLDGSTNAAELGFSAWSRTLGKPTALNGDSPKDPYGVALQAAGLYTQGHECYIGDDKVPQCCEEVKKPTGKGKVAENCNVPDLITNQSLYFDDWSASEAVRLLHEKPVGKPWFLQVNFPGPHPPFIITAAMNASVAGRSFPEATDKSSDLSDSVDQSVRQQYAAEVEHLDSLFSQVITKVNDLGERDNTLIVILSDHGEELGDHGNYGKEKPWEGGMRVPLIFSGPGVTAGQVVDAPVSTVDIGATFFEMAGISKPTDMDTVSLVPALVNGTITQECVTTGYATWRAALKKFNSSTTLKFVCCMPPGCPNPPSNIPDHKKSSNMQLLMYNTTAGASGSYDMAELGCGGHRAQFCPPEALEMAQQLPTSGYDGSWAENCTNALLYR